MKFRSTWLMGVAVGALALYTALDYRKSLVDGDLKEGERQAYSIPVNKVDYLKITRGAEIIELKKNGEDWVMLMPFPDDADVAAVEAFLYPLLSQRVKALEEDPAAKADFAKYGLADGATTIELRNGDKSETIAISTKNAFDGRFFIGIEDEVLIGDTSFAQLKERPATAFRSRRLWRIKDAKVKTIRVQDFAKQIDYTLVRGDKEWSFKDPPSFEVDAERVGQWVGTIGDFMPSDFIREEITPADESEFLLKKPSLKFTVNYEHEGKSKEWVLTAGQEKAGDVYLFTSDRPTLYKATAAALDAIRPPIDYFRERRKNLKFDVTFAKRIEVRTPKLSFSAVKSGSEWKLEGELAKTSELNDDLLLTMIEKLSALEADEFPEGPGQGIQAPQIRILGRNDKGEYAILELAWGDEYKAKAPYNSNRPMRFVKGIGNVVMGLKKETIDRLVDERIVRPRAPAAAIHQETK